MESTEATHPRYQQTATKELNCRTGWPKIGSDNFVPIARSISIPWIRSTDCGSQWR